MGGFTGYIISNISFFFYNKSLNNYKLRLFFGSIWFIPIISTTGSIYYPLVIGIQTVKRFDQGWREYFGGQILFYSLKKYSLRIQAFQNNNLKIYLLRFTL